MFKIDPPTGVLSQAGEPLKIPDDVVIDVDPYPLLSGGVG
jgi:hypothetical protein